MKLREEIASSAHLSSLAQVTNHRERHEKGQNLGPQRASAGVNDVDGGSCVTTSPVYPVAAASDLSIWYFHGQRDAGDDAADGFRVELSTNGGSTWSDLLLIGDVTVNATWTELTTSVAAGANVQLRVTATDGTAGGDLVEGGLDDLSICAP
jgi:hypothetical protein